MSDHHWDCGCWDCEMERKNLGEETMWDRQDRLDRERYALRNPIKCICPPFASHHTTECNRQDWSKNQDN